ncbi:MAG TPA: chromosome segregation protein SMC [Caldilineae bacterium]|nr:chromosome segregation protein SMC [Caldilineae bacterium]
MRLKRLELQGFKTFAQRTELVFDSGITAIVGPNGSGKSNLADAVRWVLGEQSYRLLRARRTEDMIFSGSRQRARLGMAQVTLVLDNSDGWLPVDFSEVSITRRAYRSGENEYLLNGSRVRLRDIQDLLGKSGLARRTYTVIGQGLVDQALALRPEERRSLFEEAAGITVHQAKRDEAIRRLEETQANLLRVQDILNEMAPRLRSLERQAKRAEEWKQISADLEAALRVWYGYQWHRAVQTLEQARRSEAEVAAALAERRDELAAVESHIARLRQRQAELRDRLGDWHRESSELHRRAEQVQRQLAVSGERYRMLGLRLEELEQEVAEWQRQVQERAQHVQAAEEDLKEAEAGLEAAVRMAEEARQAAEAEEARRRARQQDLERARAALVRAEAAIEDAHRRIAELEERARSLHQRREEEAARLAEAEEEVARQEGALREAEDALAACERELSVERASLEEARVAVEQARREEQQATASLAEAQRRLEHMQTRWDLLQRLHEEGAGLYAGVRRVLQAARGTRRQLTGVVGTVGELLRVPPELEVAIETALGSRLQDIVVERWDDAEAAIAYLKRTRGGRATFLPLDNLRPSKPVRAPRVPGVLGVAADLVEIEPRLRDVVWLLLGRTIVVRDLQAARRVFAEAGHGVQVVTLEGDIVRPGGSVTGGSREERRGGGMLARERERQELPSQMEEARRAVEQARRHLARRQEARSQAEAEMAARERAVAARSDERTRLLQRVQERQRALDRALQAVEWRRSSVAQFDEQIEQVTAQVAELREVLAGLEADRAARAEEVAKMEAALRVLEESGLVARAAEAQARVAAMEAERRSREEALRQAREEMGQTEAELEARQQRLSALRSEREELARDLAELRRTAEALQAEIDRLAGQIEPAEAEADRLAAEQSAEEEREASLRQQVRWEEDRHHQALLALERAQDAVERLRGEIERDLGLVQLEPGVGAADQPPLPLHPLVESLPVVTTLPEGLERDIRRLRVQLSRLGNVNPNAPAEYAEMLERHAFLSSQLADLKEAASDLRRVIEDLDALMERDFRRTFDQVARRFREHFTRLFGGGTARLELTDPEHFNETGVEIITRLPGRRAQSLALLSGGERALTAAALIFALLETNPPPFCILDEVDAALDEANIHRFRETLKALSERTQFIVITHNRGTVEVADTIYGISMGLDGVSQVLSLSMKEASEVA